MKYTEQRHPSHPEHKLELVRHEDPFFCDGCKEVGFGSRYTCARCEFDLHKDCVLPTSPAYHPFYKKCNLKFLGHSPFKCEPYCNACGLEVKGFSYHCEKYGIYLHPCCFKLDLEVIYEDEQFRLCDKVSSKCNWCRKKEINNNGVTGWAYVSKCKNYHFHVSCVKNMFLEKWEKDHGLGGDDESNKKNSQDLEVKNPNFQLIKTSKTSVGGKISKYWKIMKSVFISILSAILGDPTGGVAWLTNVGYEISQ